MNVSTFAPRSQSRLLCQFCCHISRQARFQRSFPAIARQFPTTVPQSKQTAWQRNFSNTAASAKSGLSVPSPVEKSKPIPALATAAEAAAEVANARKLGNEILDGDGIPSEAQTLKALGACISAVNGILNREKSPGSGPASALLSLDADDAATTASLSNTLDMLSNLMYALLTHPPVFITPRILDAYVRAQTLLERPSTFPDIFELYASKPTPVPGSSSPILYRDPDPHKVSSAVPTTLANLAVDAAVARKDLTTSLSIISTTFRAPAFRRAKIATKAAPPLAGAALAPVAAYAVATQLAALQDTMDPATATWVAFAGILTYVAATGTIGYVAVTTANDQMDRVTWALGMPLRERWLREEERAAADRVAGAWGFKDVFKRGEEEGEEWEFLREWVGVRGMVLDRVELMEGME